MNADERELFAGLQSLSDSAFPKTCTNCGKVYQSPSDFFTSSRPINNRTGLKSSLDDHDQPIVEVFRNCECGSTLMDFFSERRDRSAKGLKRRAVFGRMIELLEKRGLAEAEARQELIGLMNGRPSEKIEALGIRLTAAPPRVTRQSDLTGSPTPGVPGPHGPATRAAHQRLEASLHWTGLGQDLPTPSPLITRVLLMAYFFMVFTTGPNTTSPR